MRHFRNFMPFSKESKSTPKILLQRLVTSTCLLCTLEPTCLFLLVCSFSNVPFSHVVLHPLECLHCCIICVRVSVNSSLP